MQIEELQKKYFGGRHWEPHPTSYAEKFAQFLGAQKFSGTVVDLGCGAGRDSFEFMMSGFAVLGIDTSVVDIEQARVICPGCAFEVANAEKLPMADESVDACFALGVMHVADQDKVLVEIFRTLRPGGYLYAQFNESITDEQGVRDFSQSAEDIRAKMRPFEIIEETTLVRVDATPRTHTHAILEFIARKPAA